jgi:integrase
LGPWNSPESAAKYDRLVGEWLAARQAPVHSTAVDHLTIAELLLAYLKEAQVTYVKNGNETSHLHNVRDAIQVLNEKYGPEPISKFGPLKLKAVREQWMQRRLCRSTINKHVGTLKRIFRWGTENELVRPDVNQAIQAVSGLRRGRVDTKEPRPVKPVPDAYVESVRPHVSNHVWAMIQVQQLTGMRPGEVTTMRGCDVDTTGSIWLYAPASHKTEHLGFERPIYCGPRAQKIIGEFLQPDLSAYLFNPRDAVYPRQLKNSGTDAGKAGSKRSAKRVRARRRFGARYTPESYRRAIARACVLAKVPKWHPNQLRHNAATALRKEFGIEAARVVLGHRSAVVTEICAEADRGRAAEIMGRVG